VSARWPGSWPPSPRKVSLPAPTWNYSCPTSR
jgi:hypothetical protein